MSTMPATHGHNEACCNIPPVVSSGYEKKGSYEQLGGFKTYVTGPADATQGIVVIYDIFGFFDQTLQGADILATGDAKHPHKVFVPDWFQGSPCPIEWYPPDTSDKQSKLSAFFAKHSPGSVAAQLPAVVRALQAAHPRVASWGILGYCWGGKVVALATSAPESPFAVAAAVHPAMVDAADAKGIRVPMVLLASKEEPAEAVRAFEHALPGPHHVETFADQVHGWMAARADLADARVREEYARGYQTVLQFFAKHWE